MMSSTDNPLRYIIRETQHFQYLDKQIINNFRAIMPA